MRIVYPILLAAVAALWWECGWTRTLCSLPPRYSWSLSLFQWPLYIVAIGICVVWWLDATKGKTRRWRESGCCTMCGYQLTGNASGRCPECGELIPSQEQPSLRK